MSAQAVTEHVYVVKTGDGAVFLIVQPDGLTLIDAGFPGTAGLLEEAAHAMGRRLKDIHDVLMTHCHPDHAGGLAEIQRATGAKVWMHRDDAALIRTGECWRPFEVAPGEENRTFFDQVIPHAPKTIEPVLVDEELLSGQEIPVAGGVKALGTPGHSLGHLVFLWPGDGGVVFMGDAARNVDDLVLSPIYEDLAEGVRSLSMLGGQEFEVACFAHGEPIIGGAAERFRRRWPGGSMA